jgi:hypothetical protein
VSREDLVLGDDDGVLFLPSPQAEEIFTLAETIRHTERRQAERIRAGASLRTQVQFRAYLAKRENTPSLSFREHLRMDLLSAGHGGSRSWHSLLWHQWVAALRTEAAVLAHGPRRSPPPRQSQSARRSQPDRGRGRARDASLSRHVAAGVRRIDTVPTRPGIFRMT